MRLVRARTGRGPDERRRLTCGAATFFIVYMVLADFRWVRTGIGSMVVLLISDKATIELISWTPGTCDSFSKKNRS